MDRICQAIAQEDGELIVSVTHGIAWQKDQSQLVAYDEAYFDKCAGYKGGEIAKAINRGRVEIVARHFCPVSPVLDIGIGSGEFIETRPQTFGYDVNPVAVEWLKTRGLWSDDFGRFKAFTMFDVIEHVPQPEAYFDAMWAGSYVFTSIPVYADLTKIRESKHYRPNEHLYHFTKQGFISWMQGHGFECLEVSDFETRAGRDSILTFAFRKT